MPIPTEPVGSIPRPAWLLEAIGRLGPEHPDLEPLYERAVEETIALFEATGSPVITDGEQHKFHNFWTYSVHGSPNLDEHGFAIPFAAGHTRRMPRLTRGPFRYRRYADAFLRAAQRFAHVPIKQAVISPSALSLLYPEHELPDYPRTEFIDDLIQEHVTEVRQCLDHGAQTVQVDFTEARLAMKIDPSGALLSSFIDLNNLALSRFTEQERTRIGIHTCPGGDRGSTHSADIDYSELLPALFQLKAGNFYVALAGERDPERVLEIIARYSQPEQRIFVGVITPGNPVLETPELVCERVLQAARHIPLDRLGSTDDCGYSPFCDDVVTSRELAFAKIRARVEGTRMADERLRA